MTQCGSFFRLLQVQKFRLLWIGVHKRIVSTTRNSKVEGLGFRVATGSLLDPTVSRASACLEHPVVFAIVQPVLHFDPGII